MSDAAHNPAVFAARAPRAAVLHEDPELAAAIAPERQPDAVRVSFADVETVERGPWEPARLAGRAEDGYGLLVLDGLLTRDVTLEARSCAELLGPGDLLQPDESEAGGATLQFSAAWHALTRVRLALLDRSWSVRMARFPDVGVALSRRATRRSRRLVNAFAIAQHPRLDERLRLMLWELADRYGRVGPHGVRIELPITHELLSHVVGARRPSVSSALGRLDRAGLVTRDAHGWLLRGAPAQDAPSPAVPLTTADSTCAGGAAAGTARRPRAAAPARPPAPAPARR